MRLLSVGNRYPPWSLGGYETIWQRGNDGLRAAGHDVRVLSTRPDPSDALGSGARVQETDLHRQLEWYWRAHRFPRLGPRTVVALERANMATLHHHLAAFAPDAVLWWSMGGMSLSLIEQVRRAGVPALGVVADEWMAYGPRVDRWSRWWRRSRRPMRRRAERLTGIPTRIALQRGARWIFISHHLLEQARSAGRPLSDAVVVHPGVDTVRFAPTEPREWGWRLLYCGRLDPRKGVDTAVRALAHLPPAATLTLDGDGAEDYRTELVRLARQLGVGERLRLTRSAWAALPTAYAAADAVVFPVRWREPWGLVPLESMAAGRPVVASRAGGGPAEYLREEENCLGFATDDAEGLAAALTRLAADRALRESLVIGGHATADALSEEAFHAGLERELAAAVAPRAQPSRPT